MTSLNRPVIATLNLNDKLEKLEKETIPPSLIGLEECSISAMDSFMLFR